LRAVEDHHVDRPEVQAQQCVQLTGTNRPIGFDPIRKQVGPPTPDRKPTPTSDSVWKDKSRVLRAAPSPPGDAAGALSRFGGNSASETPDPIPNSAVKRRRADGTASQDAGE
jgi:hypothetical protein